MSLEDYIFSAKQAREMVEENRWKSIFHDICHAIGKKCDEAIFGSDEITKSDIIMLENLGYTVEPYNEKDWRVTWT
jgi:hypothetical protein